MNQNKTANLTVSFAITLFLILILSQPTIASNVLTADEIMEKSNQRVFYQGDSKREKIKMIITDAKGNKRKRYFSTLRLDKKSPAQESDSGRGDQFYYIYFRRPGDIKKTAFIVHKHPQGDDDRWLYLPALDLVNRIAAGDKRTSFVGSTFFYEDISGRSFVADEHKLVSTTDTYFILKSTPKKVADVEFSYYKSWIHRSSFIPVRIEYFDKNGEKYRLFENKKVVKINGRATITEGLMRDLKRGEETLIKSSAISYDLDVPEDVFTERYLRNPPSKYLK